MDVLRNGEIFLYGTVGEDLFADGFTALNVMDALIAIGRNKKAVVHINSGGGFTDEGMAIFTILDGHPGGVDVIVDSMAASAASLIAMSGKQIIMRPGSEMMIHDPSGITLGTSKDHQKAVESLESTANSMAEIYALRNTRGKNARQARDDMKEEIWMTAQQAVELGYADRVERARGSATRPMAFDYGIYEKAPERLVALARSNGWRIEGAKSKAKSTKGTAHMKREDMTDAEKTEFDAAVTAAADKKVIERDAETAKTAEAARKLAETKEAERVAALDAAKKIVPGADDAVTAERNRAADIVAACELAHYPDKATAFIAEGKALRDVVAELKKLPPKTGEVSARNGGQTEMTAEQRKQASAGWQKAVDKVNAHIAG